jgi:hypothetical protein
MSITSHHTMPISESNWDIYVQVLNQSRAYFDQLDSMEPGSIERYKQLGKAEALNELAGVLFKQFQREADLLEELRNTIKTETHV